MSRVARLGAFIVVTLAVLAAGSSSSGAEYLIQSTYQLKAQFRTSLVWLKGRTCRSAVSTAAP